MEAADITSPLAGYWRLGTLTIVPDEKDALVFGDELITNSVDRDFTGGSSNWVNSNCDTFDDTNDLSITTSATADFVYLPNAFWTKAAGKCFRLEFDASAMLGDGFRVAIGASNQTIVETVSSGANSADFVYDGSGNGNLFIGTLGSSASGITCDNFSVREITNPGNIGTTSGMAASNLALTGTVRDESDAAGFVEFDATNEYIDVATAPDLGTDFSFELVVKADSWGTTNGPYFIDFFTGGRLLFGTTSSQSYNLALYDNSATWKSFGVKVLDDLAVHHLVVTVSGTSGVLYDNGEPVGTATISASHGLDSCGDLRFGEHHLGRLYRLAMWNRTLTASEALQLSALGTHADPSKLFARGLKGCYLMGKGEQDTTSKFYDASGRGQHGTIINISSDDVRFPANGTPNSISSVLKDSPK
jgi:hypothetical protein